MVEIKEITLGGMVANLTVRRRVLGTVRLTWKMSLKGLNPAYAKQAAAGDRAGQVMAA